MGEHRDAASRVAEEAQERGDYTRALFLHGLAVETAEALAEYWHREVRRELGIPEGQGKRYSPGYPSWPELSDQRQIWKLLDPVIEHWARKGKPDAYDSGTWGPASADAMLSRDGRTWRRP